MLLPVDPVMSLIVVAGVFIYYAIKSIDASPPKDRPWSEVKREIDEYERQLEEDRRYQKWLKEHQQPES